MNAEISMPLNEKVKFLSKCPVLLGVDPAHLNQLATHMTLKAYTPHTNLDKTDGRRRFPLRAVVNGRVESVLLTAGREQRRLVGPGEFCGLGSVEADTSDGGDRNQRWRGYVVDRCQVLELYPDAFSDALAKDVLQRLVRAFWLEAWWPVIFQTLKGTREFRFIRPDIAWSMLIRGSIRELQDGETVFEGKEVPEKFVVVLQGMLIPSLILGGSSTAVGPANLLGFRHLLQGQPLPREYTAGASTAILELSSSAFVDALRTIPSLAKFIESGRFPVPKTIFTPFVCHRAVPMREMREWIDEVRTDLDAMHAYAAVVRLVPGNKPLTWLSGGVPGGELEAGADGFKEGGTTIEVLESHLGHEPRIFRHVLFDMTELGPQEADEFVVNLVETEHEYPVRPTVVLAHAGDWIGLVEKIPLPARRYALPVAVLPTPPKPGRPAAVHRVTSDAMGGSGRNDAGASFAPARLQQASASILSDAAQQMAAFGAASRNTEPTDPWPVGTVRVVREGDNPGTRMDRVARALAYRRVGVAIGGSGALSAASIPLIRAMHKKKIPIDMWSSTSFGTLLGAFYSVLGLEGFDRLLKYCWTLSPVLMSMNLFTSKGVAMWMWSFVGDVKLGDLEIPFIPVATDAANLTEYDLRSGSVAEAVSVSGSMPPGAPTYRDGRRLLDGGIVADVPCRVLADEGADLIIGVSSFAVPKTLSGPSTIFPRLAEWWGTLNPVRRGIDFWRSYSMLWHYAAFSQIDEAQMLYTSEDFGFNGAEFWKAQEIVDRSARSGGFKGALVEVGWLWRAMNPEGMQGPPPVHATDPDENLKRIADVARQQKVRVSVALGAGGTGAAGRTGTAARRIRQIRKQLVELGAPSKNLSVRRRDPQPDEPEGSIQYTA
jgi:predicted acylesterase/phospholipase RssA